MWPWEHLAVGYLTYSVLARAHRDRPPADREAVAVALGTQFPDLIDKPGGWVLGVLPSGTSLAHSIFVAVPVSLVVYALARRRGAPEVGVAFAVGYLAHLPGDVVYPVLVGRGPGFGAVLWPVVESPPVEPVATLSLVGHLWDVYVEFLTSPAGVGYLALEVGLLSLAVWVWARDGKPGLAPALRTAGLARESVGRR